MPDAAPQTLNTVRRKATPPPRMPRPVTAADIHAQWLAEAEALPQARRQAFLDAVWAGKNIGDARAAAGITFDAAQGLMAMNIVQHGFLTLNREAA